MNSSCIDMPMENVSGPFLHFWNSMWSVSNFLTYFYMFLFTPFKRHLYSHEKSGYQHCLVVLFSTLWFCLLRGLTGLTVSSLWKDTGLSPTCEFFKTKYTITRNDIKLQVSFYLPDLGILFTPPTCYNPLTIRSSA